MTCHIFYTMERGKLPGGLLSGAAVGVRYTVDWFQTALCT